MGKTGKKTRDGAGARIDIEGQVLPARYNSESTLEAKSSRVSVTNSPFSVKSK